MRLPSAIVLVVAAVAAGATCAHAQADFYYFDSKPIHLDRSATDVVVGVARDIDIAALVRDVAPGARAGNPMGSGDRRFVIVTIGTIDTDLPALRTALRMRPGVFFVAPVYVRPGSQLRIIPSDELLVRVKAGVAGKAVADALTAHGLRQVERLAGTTDQFVLRVDAVPGDTPDTDVLRVARELHETGLFLWVEPNFIQELRMAAWHLRYNSPRPPSP
jgi:hypothetical protein